MQQSALGSGHAIRHRTHPDTSNGPLFDSNLLMPCITRPVGAMADKPLSKPWPTARPFSMASLKWWIGAQVVGQPDAWMWSNYRATAGLETCPPFFDVAWTWERFGGRPAMAQRRYQRFVAEWVGQPGPWEQMRGQLYLGDDKLVAKHQTGRALRDIARQYTQAVRPRLPALLPQKHTSKQALAEAYRTHGFQMREIANHVGLHYSTVSRQIRQEEEKGA